MNQALNVSIKALRAAVASETPTLFWQDTMKHVAVLLDHAERVPDPSRALEAAHAAIAEDRFSDAIQHLYQVISHLRAECSEHVTQLAGLVTAFDAALSLRPHLWLEIGFNRVVGWMVTVYDKTGGIERVVVQAQGVNADETCQWATLHLQALTKESDHV
ncbi:hypothetical protein [Pseudomonas lactis]|uniref:hypothetical protein n=1 Tax=Pseudomonas lactis TaxID=1615674 RepID=UPI001A068552|nr:hypothetical protein [Pseudomonas lactis]MBA6042863.1 hypothetical protein [Pseudomonas lactis]